MPPLGLDGRELGDFFPQPARWFVRTRLPARFSLESVCLVSSRAVLKSGECTEHERGQLIRSQRVD